MCNSLASGARRTTYRLRGTSSVCYTMQHNVVGLAIAAPALSLPYPLQGNDRSPDISVADATCTKAVTAASDTLCWPCDLSAAQQGTCLPGSYTLNFTGAWCCWLAWHLLVPLPCMSAHDWSALLSAY